MSQRIGILIRSLNVKEFLKASPCQEIAKFVCKIASFGIKSTLQQRIDHILTILEAISV